MKEKLSTLCSPAPDPLWRRETQNGYAAWRLCWLVLMSLLWGVALLVIAAGSYPKQDILGFFETPLIAALNLLPVLLLSLLFYAAFARTWAAFLASGLITGLLAAANYYLLLFRDDPLMAQDILDISTGLGFAGKYSLVPDVWLGAVIVCFFLAMGFLLLFCRGRGAGKKLRLSLLAFVLLAAYPVTLLYASDKVYQEKARNFNYFNQWSDTQQFVSRGFLYPFFHSVKALIPQPPAGYDEQEAEALLSAFRDEDMRSERKFDLVLLQLEAFADFSRFEGMEGVDLSFLEEYHALEQQGIAGDLITNIFAGGTVDTERCALTGTTCLESYRSKSNSYAWYLRSQGYVTEGSHPGYAWFYNRRNINTYLGIEQYHYYEDYYMELADGGFTTDDILFSGIARLYEQHRKSSDAPYFSFNVSYQNHGPYDETASAKNYVTGEMTAESRNILNNYLAGAEQTVHALTDLAEELNESERPVLFLVFGDHKPWLGYGNTVYHELGIDFDLSTVQGMKNYYGTRYLLLANDAAKELLGEELTGEGETLSSAYLMNLVFETLGVKGSRYLQFCESIRETLPVLPSTGYFPLNGTVKTELTGAEADALRDYTNVSYWYREHFLYEE